MCIFIFFLFYVVVLFRKRNIRKPLERKSRALASVFESRERERERRKN